MRKLETRMRRVMNQIKAKYKQVCAGEISPEAYQDWMGEMCDANGTEYIAEAFVLLTKNGEL